MTGSHEADGSIPFSSTNFSKHFKVLVIIPEKAG